MDATALSLFRHHEGLWMRYRAKNYGRLGFEFTGTESVELRRFTHKAEGAQRHRQIDLTDVYTVAEGAPEGGQDPDESIYTSEIGECFHTLPKHVRRLVVNIPALDLPEEYHRWLIATKTEQVVLWGGGPDDGSPIYMDAYRSELGGICAGISAIGVLARSVRIDKLTASISNNSESDSDLIKTYHILSDEWCRDIPTKVQWVKGYADREGRELTRDEQLNIVAGVLTDETRANARGPYGARLNFPHWPVERETLFIEGMKVTSCIKKQLSSQLSYRKL
jgi:hypothetical protein